MKKMAQNSTEKVHDFVIVIKGEQKPPVQTYTQALTRSGLQVEFANGQKVDRTFILITMPQDALENYAKVFNVVEIRREQRKKTRATAVKSSVYSSAQKLLVLTRLLETLSFGPEKGEFGLTRLIKLRIVEAAYPLHDGSYDGEQECMRKKLWLKWAQAPFLSFAQPLDDIQQYYGWQIGFYFAWLEFFTKMLIPAAAIGSLIFVVSVWLESFKSAQATSEVCEQHDMHICPICDQMTNCVFRRLSSYCFYAKWAYVFDNYFTICFAVGMSFWATLVLNLWRRKESTLKYKWDVEFEEIETQPRPAYLYLHEIPGFLEPVLKPLSVKYLNVFNISLTASTVVCLLIVMGAAYLAIIAYRLPISRIVTGVSVYEELLAMVVGSIFLVIFIHLFERVYQKISIVLTNLENPKTQRVYDKSALYKRFLLSFANNYSFLFYIAFAKGKFFSTPLARNISFMERDTCQPFTCMSALCIQLGLLMLLKRFIWNLVLLIYIVIKEKYYKKISPPTLPQYEEDYKLGTLRDDFFLHYFCESAIEYGYVTFFVAAFPLAPLVALMNNYLMKRLMSIRLSSRLRRPSPRRISGIAEWNGVLLGLTYMSTATNAFVTGFTSDFIWREIYRCQIDSSVRGYVNSTLASFLTQDSPIYSKIENRVEICYYKGYRVPHDHPDKYKHSGDMWLSLAWRFIYVFIFEHIIFFCNAVLSSFIPKVPFTVREQKTMDRYIAKQAAWEQMTEKERQAKKKFRWFT